MTKPTTDTPDRLPRVPTREDAAWAEGAAGARLLGAIPAAVYTCDMAGRVTFFNEAAAELWGRRPLLGQDLWCGSWKIFTVDGAPLPHDQCPMAVALKEGRSVRGEEIIVERPDGVRRRIRPHPEPLRDESGALVGALNMLVDVTEQRRLEEAQARLAAIVDSSDDAIISKTLEGRITSWNAGAQRIFGYTPEEVIGRSITIIIPSDRLTEEQTILQHIRRGERVDHYETIRVAKDGTLLNISVTVSPVRDHTGRIIGASKVARDVTRRKAAEEALRTSEERLRAILSLLPAGVYACDAEGRITFYNRRAAALWGREPALHDDQERFCGGFKVYTPEGAYIAPAHTPMAVAIREGRSFRDVEAVCERPDGTRFDASVNIDPVLDTDGRILGAINVFQDVTEQVRARRALHDHHAILQQAIAERNRELEDTHRRLRLSERMASLGTLSAGLGHDFGNLLLPVRVSLDALAAADLPESARQDVERIRTSTEYLQQLAVGLRMLSLDPKRAGNPAPTDLREWWSEAHAIIRNALPPAVELEADLPDRCSVAMSRPALTQAVFNLCQNAGDALRARGRGRVRITARREGDRVHLTVADDGPGMPPEVRDHCMEPFFTTKTRAISTGLGLALVAGLVREAGGGIQLQTAPGQGAAFTLTLPAAESPIPDPDQPRRRALVEVSDPRIRALITSELGYLALDVVPESALPDPRVDLAVLDRPPNGTLARHYLLLGIEGDHPPHVTAIGHKPRPGAIRRALRSAVEQLAAAPEPAR